MFTIITVTFLSNADRIRGKGRTSRNSRKRKLRQKEISLLRWKDACLQIFFEGQFLKGSFIIPLPAVTDLGNLDAIMGARPLAVIPKTIPAVIVLKKTAAKTPDISNY